MSGGAVTRGALSSMARCLSLRCSSGAMAMTSSSSRCGLSSASSSLFSEKQIGTLFFSTAVKSKFSSSSFSARAMLPTMALTSATLTTTSTTSSTLFFRPRPRRQQRQQHSDAAATAAANSPSPSKRADSEGLRLTAAAVERVRWLLAKREAKKQEQGGGGGGGATTSSSTPAVLRLTVEAGGCSGFSYVFTLDDGGARKGDRAFGERGEVKGAEEGAAERSFSSNDPGRALLAVDPVSFDLVKGSTVDYEQELIKAGFEVVDNPNAEAGCGCGSSFAAKVF